MDAERVGWLVVILKEFGDGSCKMFELELKMELRALGKIL